MKQDTRHKGRPCTQRAEDRGSQAPAWAKLSSPPCGVAAPVCVVVRTLRPTHCSACDDARPYKMLKVLVTCSAVK